MSEDGTALEGMNSAGMASVAFSTCPKAGNVASMQNSGAKRKIGIYALIILADPL